MASPAQPSRNDIHDFILYANLGIKEKVVEFLDQFGDEFIDIQKDPMDLTALMQAAWQGHTEIVEELLKRGADVEKETKPGWTALMYAAWRDKPEAAELLLQKGAALDKKNNNQETALMIAAKDGHTEVAELLLEKGAAMDAVNKNGHTALNVALLAGRLDMVRLLKAWETKREQMAVKAKKQAIEAQKRFIEETDCSKGIKEDMPSPRRIITRRNLF